MSRCLSADAILTLGDALDWDIEEGLRHLKTCEECRAQLEVLRLTRAGFLEEEPVDVGVVQEVATALGAAAQSERQRARARERWAQSVEAFLAGITALIVLSSSRIPIDDAGTAMLGFVLGASLMVSGRMLARKVPAFAQGVARV